MRSPPRLLLLTPGDVADADGQRVVQLVKACVGVGLGGVVLREPQWCDRVTLAVARRLRTILGDGWLCLHDRVHLVEAARADAVHLGWRSLAPRAARDLLPSDVGIGYSSHVDDDPRTFEGCDYLVFGPVRDTPSKRGVRGATGFDALAHRVKSTTQPVWALGGMRPEDAPEARASGTFGLAVLGGIAHAADPASACARYLASMGGT